MMTKFKRIAGVSLLLVLLTACPDSQEISNSGKTYANLNIGDITLNYIISIPEKYSSDEATPMILALPDSSAEQSGETLDFLQHLIEPAFKDLGAILVIPACPSYSWTSAVSENALLALIDYIKMNHAIDARRVVITGYGYGAMGALYMSAKHPAVFSAALCLSGHVESDFPEYLNNLQRPVFFIHGSVNREVPLQRVKHLVDRIRNATRLTRIVVVPGVDHSPISLFTEALKDSIPWLRRIWNR